jgi:hypothetical protein
MTWPLATHLGTRLAADLGDPAFNSWVLAWGAGQILDALGGNPRALATYWHGNIFYNEPLTLAYSEHMTAQVVQILPVYAATGNILVAYNLLFISTFALSGLAVYLLVRDMTERPLAAFLAGLAYAYAPYRMGQISHVQVLSSYWMPLAILGFHRYFSRVSAGTSTRAALRALAGGAAALVMQHWSCGYYMLFFAPFIASYCLYEVARRGLVRDARVWSHLALAALAVAISSWPFIAPYLELRELTGLGVRSLGELRRFSADTHAFATASAPTRLSSAWMPGYFKAEGEGFAGFTILAFSVIGLLWGFRRWFVSIRWREISDAHFVAIAVAGLTAAVGTGVTLWFLVHGSLSLSVGSRTTVYGHVGPALYTALGSLVAFLGLVTLTRRERPPVSPAAFGFVAWACLAAALFALGPRIEAAGHGLGPGPYLWLYEYIPGFDGLRVPARMLMLVALFLSILTGIGATTLLSVRARRFGAVVVFAGAVGVLAEGWVAPISMNLPVLPGEGLRLPPAPHGGNRVSDVYRVVRDLPDPVVLAELPFGDEAYDITAVFYAGFHRRPLLNGFSGFIPGSYPKRRAVLGGLPEDAERAAELLRSTGVTHVLVHEGAFQGSRGKDVSTWLEHMGGTVIASVDGDRLFVLPWAGQ